MKNLLILAFLSLFVLFGCAPEEVPPEVQKTPQKVMIEVGDSYESVLERLGKPNVSSATKNSRVMIYDEIEIKLKNNSVSVVYDHRGS